MSVYKINPLRIAEELAGVGFNSLIPFIVGSENVDTFVDDFNYNVTLSDGGEYEDKEYRLSKKAHHQGGNGIAIADRFVEFVVDESIYLVESPIFRVNRPKIINKTQVFGFEGTVKEFLALGDYTIDFSFFIYGKRRFELDYDETKDFLELANLGQSIAINSPFLNYVYDIDQIVIESLNSIEEHATYKNVVAVNMTLSSDEIYTPFEEK